MAVTNIFQTSDLVINDIIDDYSNSLGTTYLATPFNNFNDNATVGTSMRATYPLRFQAVDTLAVTDSDYNSSVDRYVNIALTTETAVPISITAKQMTFSSSTVTGDEFMKKFGNPMAIAAANRINAANLSALELIFTDAIGDPTAALNGITTLTTVNAQAANMAISRKYGLGDLYMGLSPNTIGQLKIPYATYFNEGVNSPILKNATTDSATLSGVHCYQDEQMIVHTNGTFATGGSVTVAANVTSGTINDTSTAVNLEGFTASQTGVLVVGDLIYFGSTGNYVNAINPLAYNAYGNPKKFVVLEDVDSDGAGDATVNVFPPIVSTATDPYRNVSRQVVSGDVVTLFGGANTTYTKNFCFVRPALQFANPKVATYPISGKDGQKLSAYPHEQTIVETVPETDLRIAFNIAAQGDLNAFENNLITRSISGFTAFNGYGFVVASSI